VLKHDLRQRGERPCTTIVHSQARIYRISFHRKISPIVSLLKSCVLVQDAVPEKDFGQVWRDRLRLVQLESNGWEVYSCDLSHDESLGVMGRHLQSNFDHRRFQEAFTRRFPHGLEIRQVRDLCNVTLQVFPSTTAFPFFLRLIPRAFHNLAREGHIRLFLHPRALGQSALGLRPPRHRHNPLPAPHRQGPGVLAAQLQGHAGAFGGARGGAGVGGS